MKNILFTISLGIVILLTGCSRYSPITKASETESYYKGAVYQPILNFKSEQTTNNIKYRVYHQAATGYISKQTVLNSVSVAMNKFCKQKNKDVLILEEYTVSGYGIGKFPSAEVIFACVDKKKTSNNISISEKLKELKQMQEDGIITLEEYNSKRKSMLDNY